MVYSVKYALTDGNILEMSEKHYLANETLEGKTWFRSRSDALKKAKDMRDKKIISLRKKIVTLEQMKFEENR